MKRYLKNLSDSDTPIGSPDSLPMSDWVSTRRLAANVAESFTVPAGAKCGVFTSLGANSFISGYVGSPTRLATVPSADVTDGTASIPLPDGMPRLFRVHDLEGGFVDVISAGTPDVSVEWLG